jgi:hypothetical protein
MLKYINGRGSKRTEIFAKTWYGTNPGHPKLKLKLKLKPKEDDRPMNTTSLQSN